MNAKCLTTVHERYPHALECNFRQTFKIKTQIKSCKAAAAKTMSLIKLKDSGYSNVTRVSASTSNDSSQESSQVYIVPMSVPVLFCSESGVFLRQLVRTNKVSLEPAHYATTCCDLRKRMANFR